MISFGWEQVSQDQFTVRIKTPVVRVGTLYRLTAAIYVLGLDIVSGIVDSVTEEGMLLSNDEFLLRFPDQKKDSGVLNESVMQLGVIMETLLGKEIDPDILLAERNIKPPEPILFFESQPDIVFQDHLSNQCTEFYIEVVDRRGLLFHLTRNLAKMNINILKADIRAAPGGMAEDTFYLQYNEKPLGMELSKQIEHAILGK